MTSPRHILIRSLFEEYVELYESRNDLLTTRLSENFCGYTGGGNFLVDDRQVWIDITRQDFAQLPARAHIEVLDLKLQDLHDDIVVVTALTHIRLPMPTGEISREFVRLTLIFRREGEDWKAVYVGVSIPDQLVRDGEVYPITGLLEQNQALQRLLDERTLELSAANEKLKALTPTKDQVRQCHTISNFLQQTHKASELQIDNSSADLQNSYYVVCTRRTLCQPPSVVYS